MREQPLLSVVTPVFNQARYLQWTLRSIQAQSYPRIEHIVVDGGSTDGTLELLRTEGEAGRLRWLSEPDRGMYDGINKGLAMAGGEVLAYLNSDDAWLPWAVERVMAEFASHPALEIVYGDGIKVNEDTGRQRLRLFPPFDRVNLANYESLMQPAVFWRRRLYERMGGFDPGLRYVGDLDYWLRASTAGAPIRHVNEVIAIERIHRERLSTARKAEMAAEDDRMRAGHAGDLGGPMGRGRSVSREARWQRWLWLRFLAAYTLRGLPGPWGRFVRRGGVTVDSGRLLHNSRPGMSQGLWGAVASELAARTLGIEPVPARARQRFLLRWRVLTLGVVFRELVAAGAARLARREWQPGPPSAAAE